jgi:hypothetical protein
MNYVPVEDVASLITLCLSQPHAINQEFIILDQLPLCTFVQIICNEFNIKNKFYKVLESLVRLFIKFITINPKIPLTQARLDALTIRVRYSMKKINTELKYTI